jgi:hypothetical protein
LKKGDPRGIHFPPFVKGESGGILKKPPPNRDGL